MIIGFNQNNSVFLILREVMPAGTANAILLIDKQLKADSVFYFYLKPESTNYV